MKLRTAATVCLLFVGLWIFRVAYAETGHYDFLWFNVLLAAIPLLIEPLFKAVREYRTLPRRAYTALLGVVWLLFMPNTFYLLTDFMHLNNQVLVNMPNDGYRYTVAYSRGDPLFIYDAMVIFAAAAFGAYAGALALLHAYRYFARRWSIVTAQCIIALLMVLVAVGIYLGRFGRWNSWEGLLSPVDIIVDLVNRIQTDDKRFVMSVVTFVIFQGMSLYAVSRITRHSRRPLES